MMRKNKLYKIFIPILLIVMVSFSYSQERDSLTVNYNLINSFPQNAEVYFNGNKTGNTPFRFIFSSADSVNGIDIVVKKKGYIDFSFRINKDELPLNKTIDLISSVKKPSIKDNLVTEKKSSLFKSKRKIVPIVISSFFAGTGAALGFIFKSKANENYDQYVLSGDREKLDETKKYDLLSGISLAAFQVGFTSLIYFLLID
jgi:hypothetical protein